MGALGAALVIAVLCGLASGTLLTPASFSASHSFMSIDEGDTASAAWTLGTPLSDGEDLIITITSSGGHFTVEPSSERAKQPKLIAMAAQALAGAVRCRRGCRRTRAEPVAEHGTQAAECMEC